MKVANRLSGFIALNCHFLKSQNYLGNYWRTIYFLCVVIPANPWGT